MIGAPVKAGQIDLVDVDYVCMKVGHFKHALVCFALMIHFDTAFSFAVLGLGA